jgi:hypothetical protein
MDSRRAAVLRSGTIVLHGGCERVQRYNQLFQYFRRAVVIAYNGFSFSVCCLRCCNVPHLTPLTTVIVIAPQVSTAGSG